MSVASALSANAAIVRANFDLPRRPFDMVTAVSAMSVWGTGLVGSVASAAARYPHAEAVIDEYGSLTYRQLWQRSGHLGWSLERLGVRPGTRVGVLARNHRGFVEAMLAVSRTGADLVLLNTEFAAPQLADVVASEDITLVLHDDEFAEIVRSCGAQRLVGEKDQEALARGTGSLPPRREGRMIILTSGTTGRPKGAARRGDESSIEAVGGILRRIPYRARDTQVIAAPLFHGWGLTNLVLGLARAATTVLRRRPEPTELLRTVAGRRATVLVVVPVILARILALGARELMVDTSKLRVIASSGSAIEPHLVRETLDRFGPVLYNVYGSTEVAIATIATPHDLRRVPNTAGRPVSGAKVRILGMDGQPQPNGAGGRVFVGSSMRFEGYTGGGAKEVKDGLLCSGDIGYFLDDLLIIDGREDDMIVSGGENVFPQEVEQLLAAHPAVAEVAVLGVPDPEFGQSLAAFVVPRDGVSVDEEALRAYVRERLARFKVPRRIVELDSLPRTATGKVLRRELQSL